MSAAALATLLHALAAVVWVGGMFFAHMTLRPALPLLEPPLRLTLWGRVFGRFFLWVWAAVVTLLATGYYLVLVEMGGFHGAGRSIEIMHGLGLTMVGLFVFLYTVPYRKFRTALAAENWPEAGRHQARIRRIVAVNLVLGLVTVALGAGARFLG